MEIKMESDMPSQNKDHDHICMRCKMSPEKLMCMVPFDAERELKSIRDTGYCTECLLSGED
jgi:hypothetical protein